MQNLAYLTLAAALLLMSASEWTAAAVLLAVSLLVWTWDWPNRRSDS